jgi:hypothetical protein
MNAARRISIGWVFKSPEVPKFESLDDQSWDGKGPRRSLGLVSLIELIRGALSTLLAFVLPLIVAGSLPLIYAFAMTSVAWIDLSGERDFGLRVIFWLFLCLYPACKLFFKLSRVTRLVFLSSNRFLTLTAGQDTSTNPILVQSTAFVIKLLLAYGVFAVGFLIAIASPALVPAIANIFFGNQYTSIGKIWSLTISSLPQTAFLHVWLGGMVGFYLWKHAVRMIAHQYDNHGVEEYDQKTRQERKERKEKRLRKKAAKPRESFWKL